MTRKVSRDGSSRTPPTRSPKANSGTQASSTTLGKAVFHGALADACRLIHMGWTLRPVVNSIMLDHPDLSIDQARAIYQYAAEACAAAILINEAGPNYVHSPAEVPHIRE